MSYSRNNPGKIRRRLAELLCETLPRDLDLVAFEIQGEDLWSSRSPERRFDDQLGTWGGGGTATDHNGARISVLVGSYDTMTACVRRGIVAIWCAGRFTSGVDVLARDPEPAR